MITGEFEGPSSAKSISEINMLVACVRIAHEQLSVICWDQVRDGINFEASNGVLLHVSPLVLAALSS
jgi:hypothetical protein